MTEPTFRELVDAAVEAREPLDTPEFARRAGAASEADRGYWRSQSRLDVALREWRRAPASVVRRPHARTAATVVAGAALRGWRTARAVQTASALALGLSAVVVWSGREVSPPDPVVTVPIAAAVISEPTPEPRVVRAPVAAPRPRAAEVETLALADGLRPRGGFEEATATAERLAYAFEPVGNQVGSVVRLLIDAVPGADVFSM